MNELEVFLENPSVLKIEIARAKNSGDPYAFPRDAVPLDYVFRLERGYESACFDWSGDVLRELHVLLHAQAGPVVMRKFGERLRRFLEDGLRSLGGWESYEKAIVEAVRRGSVFVVCFRFGAAELYSLPWELVVLRSTGQYLGAVDGCLLQYEWPSALVVPLTPSGEAAKRVLYGWSGSGGRVPASEHRTALVQSAKQGGWRFDPEQDILPGLSRASLRDALGESRRSGRPVSHLHLLCHGKRMLDGSTGLLWEPRREGDEPDFIGADELGELLAPYVPTLRTVVLCACYGGDPGMLGNALGSVAQALHRLGVEAVVASRLPLSVEGSIVLAETFYLESGRGLDSVRLGFARARQALRELESLDWASLQLFASETSSSRPRISALTKSLLLGAALIAPVAVVVVVAPQVVPDYFRQEKEQVEAVLPSTSPEGVSQRVQVIAGRIFDERSRPLPAANVTLIFVGRTVSAYTDSRGRFGFEMKADWQAAVELEVHKVGYKPRRYRANLGNTELGFILSREDE